MKSALLAILCFSSFASADVTYNISAGDVCVLQIMKEGSPSLVIACGTETKVNNPIQAYSEMANSQVFQSEAKRIFMSRLDPSKSLVCNEYDNPATYIVLCK